MEERNKAVTELDLAGLDVAITGQPALVVDFYAPWCPDCHAIAPVLAQLAAGAGRIAFAAVDVDAVPGVKERFEIMAVPTLLVFRDGELVERWVEPAPRTAALQKELDRCFPG